jgi:hypothetical protein
MHTTRSTGHEPNSNNRLSARASRKPVGDHSPGPTGVIDTQQCGCTVVSANGDSLWGMSQTTCQVACTYNFMRKYQRSTVPSASTVERQPGGGVGGVMFARSTIHDCSPAGGQVVSWHASSTRAKTRQPVRRTIRDFADTELVPTEKRNDIGSYSQLLVHFARRPFHNRVC